MRCNHCGSVMCHILTDTLGMPYYQCVVCDMVQDQAYTQCNGKRVAYTIDAKVEVCVLPDFHGIKRFNMPRLLVP